MEAASGGTHAATGFTQEDSGPTVSVRQDLFEAPNAPVTVEPVTRALSQGLETPGSIARALVMALPLALALVLAWLVFTALWFRVLGDATWLLAVPLCWALGTTVALGFGQVGRRPAVVAALLAAGVVLFGGYAVERVARPDLSDPYYGFRDVDRALWVIEGRMPDIVLREALGGSTEEWSSVTESQRAQLEAPLLDTLQARLEEGGPAPRLTPARYLGQRLTSPFVFFCAGLGLALAWRAARGGDFTSLVWLRAIRRGR